MAFTLDPSKSNLANLLRIEVLPRLVVHVLKEWYNVDRVHEIDESVSDVAAIVQVERQVEKVKSTLMQPVDALQEHFFRVLVRNMTDHNRGAPVLTAEKPIKIDGELRITTTLLSIVLLVVIAWVVRSHGAERVLHTWRHWHLLGGLENWGAFAEWVNLTVEVILFSSFQKLEA